MKTYFNFKLVLAEYRLEDGYKSLTVYVDEAPVRAQDRSKRVEVKFPEKLIERHEKLRYRELPEEELIEFGEDLAALLFPNSVREIYNLNLAKLGANQGLRIQVYTGEPEQGEPDLGELELPWEYAYIPTSGTSDDSKGYSGFLALDRRISIVRYRKLDVKASIPSESKVVNVVALLSDGSESTHGKLDMFQEEENLRRALDVEGVELEILPKGKLDDLGGSLAAKDAHVFHYAGHGTIKKEPLDEPFTFEKTVSLVLAGEHGGPELWDGEKVAMQLGNRGIQLVVLSACDSGLSGLVPALLKQNIPAVIGMQFTVLDANAVAFGRRFFQALASGQSIDTAVSEGRQSIFQSPVVAGRDWGVPVLHLQTDNAELFPRAKKTYSPHRILAGLTALVIAYWFFVHIYPWLFHNTSRFWEWLGMGGAALAGFILVVKALLSETWKTWLQKKIESWKDRFLPSRLALPFLVGMFLISIVLLAGTKSIYLEVDYPRDVKINITTVDKGRETTDDEEPTKIKDKKFWKGRNTLSLSQDEGRLLAGGPVFFDWWPVTLELSIEKAVEWRLSETEINLNPFVSKRIKILPWYIVRIVPGKGLSGHFIGTKKKIWMDVQIGDTMNKTDPVLLTWGDGRLQPSVVYLGAPGKIRRMKEKWDEELTTCNNKLKEEHSPFQYPGDIEPSLLFAPGQTISIKVFMQSLKGSSPPATDPGYLDVVVYTDIYPKQLDESSEQVGEPVTMSEDIVITSYKYPDVVLEESDFSKNEVFTLCLDL